MDMRYEKVSTGRRKVWSIELRAEDRLETKKTWLENVEADMAKLEINKEDVHDRSKWRSNVNLIRRKSNPIRKRTINR